MRVNRGDTVWVVPLGRKNRQTVRATYVVNGIWRGFIVTGRGGTVCFKAEDVIEVVPDPYA